MHRIGSPGETWSTIPIVPGRRRGYSLIQMLVVITTAAVLVSIAAGAIHTLLRTQGAMQEHLRLVTLRARLARVFREDVHASSAGAWDAAAGTLTLARIDGGEIVYSLKEDRLLREATGGAEPPTRELFMLIDTTAAFEILPADAPRQVRLVLRHPGPLGRSTVRNEFAILAALGRDGRFARNIAGGAP